MIKYWDIERKRYPQYKHTAVLIAEDVDSRFLNVIHLFNGFVPLIVLKMTAYEINDGIALTFSKVLDEVNLGLVDEDEPIVTPTDRAYWENRSKINMLEFTDQLFALIKATNPDVELKYNKHYIGLANAGVATNYCEFVPRKESVTMAFKISQSAELTDRLDKSDFEVLTYDSQWGQYRLKMKSMPSGEDKDLLIELIKIAMDNYRK